MHSVHLPEDGDSKDGYFGAVMGLIFDTQKYDPSITKAEVDIIDAFFDSLKWNELSIDASGTSVKKKSLEYVNYGQLMNIAKTHERFVYTGSLTTPPCTEKVFWNVINRVYPIKPRHLAQFQYLIQQQGRTAESKGKMTPEGNYREIQTVLKQDPKLMVPNTEDQDDIHHKNRVMTIVLLVIVVKVLILSGILFMILNNKDREAEEYRSKMQFRNKKKILDDVEIEFAPR